MNWVWNEYAAKLGVPTDQWQFVDVFGLDPELLLMLPLPVKALLVLFPITEKYEQFRKTEDSSLTKEQGMDSLFFTRQTIGNACGTIALIHAVLNNRDSINLAQGSVLDELNSKNKGKSPEEVAKYLETDTKLAAIHSSAAVAGQTAAPSTDEDVDLHFICFVEKNGTIYELDGRKRLPVNHGPTSDFLQDASIVVKKFMERDPENFNFTVMALAAAS